MAEATLQDRAKGCILGAFIGDSLGEYLEFEVREFTDEEVQAGMGNVDDRRGVLAPGQVTDDSELAMCLMQGLIAGGGKLDLNEICSMYGKWMKSPPFDIGQTTSQALMHTQSAEPDPSKPMKAAM